jgi:hypothetical protein
MFLSLEVLPYLLTALIAAIVVPGFLYSQVCGTKAGVTANVHGVDAPELARQGHVERSAAVRG